MNKHVPIPGKFNDFSNQHHDLDGETQAGFKVEPFLGGEPPSREDIRHSQFGCPTDIWCYRDGSGYPVTLICRFNTEDGSGKASKEYRPYTHGSYGSGPAKWHWKGYPGDRRPLFQLDKIASDHRAVILVCEGEKTAVAAHKLFPDYVATSPMHGAKSPHKTDWTSLRGRHVVIAADLDTAGSEFANQVAMLATKARASSVEFLNVDAIAKAAVIDGQIGEPDEADRSSQSAKYDLADALEDGWTSDLVKALFDADGAPKQTRPYLPPGWPFRSSKFGVDEYVVVEGTEKKPGFEGWVRMCSPIEVRGHARAADNDDWSYVVEVTDRDGNKHQILVRASDLIGKTLHDTIAQLASHGLVLEGPRFVHRLVRYFTHSPFDQTIRIVTATGWQTDGRYVLPDAVIPEGGEDVFYDTPKVVSSKANQSGELSDWMEQVAAHGVGNPLIAISIAAAFAPVFLKPLGQQGFGLHFFGGSSTGKTTALTVAASVWGMPSEEIKNWNMTTTALESIAAVHCDSVLCLDEIGQGDPYAVLQAAYLLANGQGRGRGDQKGQARALKTWLVVFLSNGETAFDRIVDNKGNQNVKAGQRVRIMDIPADGGTGNGIFSRLPAGMSASELAILLKNNAGKFHGVAGREFLHHYTADPQAALAQIRFHQDAFLHLAALEGADGQVQRVAQNLSLIAAVGELAIEFDILPWPSGTAMAAAKYALARWIEHRGGTEADETVQGIRTVARFLEQNGDSQFTTIVKENNSWIEDEETRYPPTEPASFEHPGLGHHETRDRAGFKYQNEEGDWVYLILSQAWSTRVCVGRDPKQVANALAERGHLTKDGSGKNSVLKTLPGMSRSRVYQVNPSIFSEDY